MKKYFLIVLSVLALASCKDLLNLAPTNKIASENMWTTESLADQGMLGIYKGFTANGGASISLTASGLNRHAWDALGFASEWFGDGPTVLTGATKYASDAMISHEWQWCYDGIHRANDAIANLYKAGLDEAKYERYMCEAMFVRAFFYFRLNEIFEGVPIYTEPISNEECTKGQSSAQEVWELVIEDLTYCIENSNFPDNTLTSNYGRPSKGAAYSLRGMAYMWLAYLNNESTSYYQLAANDFEKVSNCGYGLWQGNYIDFFNYDNEKDHEMIFPIQWSTTSGYADNLQYLVACSDCYGGSGYWRVSSDFVNYFQNADGSTFNWADVIPEWDDAVFTNDVGKREVFFLRDSICFDGSTVSKDYLDDAGNVVIEDYWMGGEGQLLERIQAIGVDVFQKYYIKNGNEDRLRAAYNNRDPRLKDIVLVPYDPYDVYSSGRNGGVNCYGKEMRHPFALRDTGRDYGDFFFGNAYRTTYCYKKYVYNKYGDLESNTMCPTDWPLIRYTDIYLHLAECYVKLNNLSQAVSIVNEIRSRAGMPSVSVGTADQVMEAVRYERRIELCMEGHDWFDEWRWGTYKEMKLQGNDRWGTQNWWGEYDQFPYIWYYDDCMYPWPAPDAEILKNSNFTRRDGWAY